MKNKISKKFKEQFPKAFALADRLDAKITWHDRAWWLDSCVRLTGYVVGKENEPLGRAGNETIALERLEQFKKGREELQSQTVWQRFAHLMEEGEKLELKWKHFTTYRHVGGDKITAFSDGSNVIVDMVGIDRHLFGKGNNLSESIADLKLAFKRYIGTE